MPTRQRGFTLYLLLGALAVFAVGSAIIYWQQSRYDALNKEYAGFQAQVKANGEAAERETKRINTENAKKKEKIDNENIKLRADVAAIAKRLRDARAASGFLPPAASGSASPDRIAFDRAQLERTLQRFDAGVSGIVAEGDGALTDLNSAREWAADRR